MNALRRIMVRDGYRRDYCTTCGKADTVSAASPVPRLCVCAPCRERMEPEERAWLDKVNATPASEGVP